MPIRITPLAQADPLDIEALLDAAFGAGRRTRTAYRIRAGMTAIPELSFAAFDDDRLVGSLQCWPVVLGDVPLTLVGPVAVAPDLQRDGIGRAMMMAMLEVAGTRSLAMIGDPEYYGRFFGFTADATGGWSVPGPVDPRRLLARNADELPRSGALGPRTFADVAISA